MGWRKLERTVDAKRRHERKAKRSTVDTFLFVPESPPGGRGRRQAEQLSQRREKAAATLQKSTPKAAKRAPGERVGHRDTESTATCSPRGVQTKHCFLGAGLFGSQMEIT